MIKKISLSLCAMFLVGCNQPETRYAIIEESDKDGVNHESGYVIVKPIYKQIFDFDGNYEFFNHPHFVTFIGYIIRQIKHMQ